MSPAAMWIAIWLTLLGGGLSLVGATMLADWLMHRGDRS